VDGTDDYVVVVHNGAEERLIFDTIVHSLGMEMDTDAVNRLRPLVNKCYVVGNSNGKSCTVRNAVTSAYDATKIV
jgi:hypothetical protein